MKLQSASSSQTSLLVLVLSLLSSLRSVSAAQPNQFCPLCATQADFPARWDYRLSDGRTCRQVYLYLSGISSSNAMCQTTKNMAQEACCSATAPQSGGSDSSPTTPGAYTGQVGNEPVCPICGTMEYPGIPQGFVTARYVGEYSCHQLYGRGLNGMIPLNMCGPVQDFAKTICGCGQYNPKCQADPSQCWGSSGSSPVASPTSAPVQSTSSYSLTSGKKNGGKNKRSSAYALRGGRRAEEESDYPDEDEDEPIQAQPKEVHFEARMNIEG